MPNHRITPVIKSCPTCKQDFETCPPGHKSRYYPAYKQVFCSRDCAFKSRYRRGQTCAELPAHVAAYIAGFLDGEGSVILYRRRDKVAMRVGFANTNKPILDWIAQVTDCGGFATKEGNGAHKRGYILQFNADAAASLLRQIRPYLHIKATQADLALDFQERLKDPALNSDRTWQYEYQEHMRSMNRRGPQLTTGANG